jgi:hypothetical protein
MGPARTTATALVAAAAFAVIGATGAKAQGVTPPAIPPSSITSTGPGFVFPLPAATIENWITENNQVAIRQRAWALWQAMTAPSGQIYNGTNLPVWETWWGSNEIFNPNPQTGFNSGSCDFALQTRVNRQPTRALINPNQLSHLSRGLRASPGAAAPAPSPADFQVVAFNKFNADYGNFVTTWQPGPPGSANYCYATTLSLNALAGAMVQLNIPPAQRQVNPFPAGAIATKPVMGLVKASGITVLPVWQGPANSTNATNPTPSTWRSCVVVNPAFSQRPAGPPDPAIIPRTPNLACTQYSWALLSDLYSFPMSPGEAAAFNATQPQGQGANAGDYAVLLAMHVTTKETPRWTWQTFYWQPNGDTPNAFPGSKANQPSTLPSPWNNYAMCTAYSQTTPFNSPNMTVCFNPYLETSAGIPAGITSNCMSCHGVAQNGAGTYPPSYTAPIQFFTAPRYFPVPGNGQYIITDFSWATAGPVQ